MTERRIWHVLCAAAVLGMAWGVAEMDWAPVWPSASFLAQALGRSWLLAVIALGAGAAAAVPLAALRLYAPRAVAGTTALVIEAIRVTPELMIVFWIYFALPVVTGSTVTAWTAALWALGVIAAAHLAEVIRAGLLSVPDGQVEAARALGLTRLHGFCLIVLPQAARNMVPALLAQFVALFKTTSLAYAIGADGFLPRRHGHQQRDLRPVSALHAACGGIFRELLGDRARRQVFRSTSRRWTRVTCGG